MSAREYPRSIRKVKTAIKQGFLALCVIELDQHRLIVPPVIQKASGRQSVVYPISWDRWLPLADGGEIRQRPFAANLEKWEAAIRYALMILPPERRKRSGSRQSPCKLHRV
jgi:hypothetical protein